MLRIAVVYTYRQAGLSECVGGADSRAGGGRMHAACLRFACCAASGRIEFRRRFVFGQPGETLRECFAECSADGRSPLW